MYRSLIGLVLPEETNQAVRAVQMELRRRGSGDYVKWNPPAELALVLLNLGEVPLPPFQAIAQALAEQTPTIPAFTLHLSGVAGIPNSVMPRSVAIQIQGPTENDFLVYGQVRQYLAQLLAPIQPLPAQIEGALIEIGRVRVPEEKARTETGRTIKLTPNADAGRLRVDQIQLLVQEVTANGPALRPMHTFPLRQ